jgi:hypothetical protein
MQRSRLSAGRPIPALPLFYAAAEGAQHLAPNTQALMSQDPATWTVRLDALFTRRFCRIPVARNFRERFGTVEII